LSTFRQDQGNTMRGRKGSSAVKLESGGASPRVKRARSAKPQQGAPSRTSTSKQVGKWGIRSSGMYLGEGHIKSGHHKTGKGLNIKNPAMEARIAAASQQGKKASWCMEPEVDNVILTGKENTRGNKTRERGTLGCTPVPSGSNEKNTGKTEWQDYGAGRTRENSSRMLGKGGCLRFLMSCLDDSPQSRR